MFSRIQISPNRLSTGFETSFGSSPTVKDKISSRLFTDHKSINSICHAAHLYYQLSETLHSKGKLKWTKQAFEKYIDYGDLTLSMAVAEEYFSRSPSFWDSKDYILTSSYVLQCYLESVLQIGTLHEMLATEAIARDYLLNGKAISRSQDLPTFEILFSYVLGKIHKKKRDSSMEIDEFRIGTKRCLQWLAEILLLVLIPLASCSTYLGWQSQEIFLPSSVLQEGCLSRTQPTG